MTGEIYRDLGEAAWAWVLGQVRDDEGPWLPEVVAGDGPPAGPDAARDSLYAGIGGLAPILAELGQHRALTGAEQAKAAPGGHQLHRAQQSYHQFTINRGPAPGLPVHDRHGN